MKKMSDSNAFGLLKRYKIPVVKQLLARNENHAITFAKNIGYPVVMKLSSPEVIHKTEFKAIALNIKNDNEARVAFKELTANAKKRKIKRIDGILVQKMQKGHEVIIGSKIDPQFGPVILFGLGGIFVEVFKDVTMRLIPIERRDAREMIQEIKGYQMLNGARGQKPVNFKALENCLMGVSNMVWKNKKVKELDINPLFVNEREAIAVDVRIFTE